MPVRVTTEDIAKHLEVSAATVRHVLSGKADRVGIRMETRQRVLDAAQQLGYRVNTSARTMRTGRFGNVALVQPFRNVYLPSSLTLTLARELDALDMHLVIAQLPDERINEEEYLPKIVRELAADGLLVNMLVGIPEHFYTTIRKHAIPTIWMNTRQEADCVHPDDFGGGRIAASHLLALKHRRIAFLSDVSATDCAAPHRYHYSSFDRFAGYAERMREEGLPPAQIVVAPLPDSDVEFHATNWVKEASAALTAPNRPTAVIAYEQSQAISLLIAAARVGLRVPEDLSLVMFHEGRSFEAGLPITTVSHSMNRLGEEAARMFAEKLKNPSVLLPPRVYPTHLAEGSTCAVAPP